MLIEVEVARRLERKKDIADELAPSKRALGKYRKERMAEYIYHSRHLAKKPVTREEIEEIFSRSAEGRREQKFANEKQALEIIYKKPKIDEALVLKLHTVLFEGVRIEAGRYRMSDAIGVPNVPSWEMVPRMVSALLNRAVKNPHKLYNIELAAFIHNRFTEIRPFNDGNGRIGRLLMNLILMHDGYPLVILTKDDEKEYLEGLMAADRQNLVPFANLVAERAIQALDLYIARFEK